MKKSIIALAVAGALTAPLAQADATLYGVAQFRLIDKDEQSLNSQMAKTRLGVKGTVDNDIEGLTTGFQFEWEFSGANGDDAGISEVRKSLVYMKGDFGQVTFGKQNSPMVAYKKADLLGHNSAAFGQTGDRVANAISYATPEFAGFQLTGAVVSNGAAEDGSAATPTVTPVLGAPTLGTDATTDSEDADAYIVAATYGIAGLDFGIGYEATNNSADNTDTDTLGVGVSYSMDALTLAAYFEDEERDAGADREHYELYAGYSFGKTTVGVQYANLDIDGANDDQTKTALRVDYALGSSAGVALEIADYNDEAAGADAYTNDNIVLEYTLSF